MSVLEPPDDEDPIDAEIVEDSGDADVLAALEADLSDVVLEPGDTQNVRELSPKQLLDRFAAVERKLREMQELMVPRTQEGRDLHSERTAYLVELRRRKMR